jgi:recombination protein RecA
MVDTERLCVIEELKKDLNEKAKKSGYDLLLTSLRDEAQRGIQVFSTRTPSLDIALGIGGIPRGRITEIYGPQQSGKTTVALQTAAVCQAMGGSILYIDAEQAVDPIYCAALGLDIERQDFILCQPDYGEQALDVVLEFLKKGCIDLIIIDSIAMLTPLAKIETILGNEKDAGSLQDAGKFVGTQARMIGNFLGAAPSLVKKSNTALIVLNQIRKEFDKYGSREGRLGGNSLAHATSVVIDVRRTETEEVGKKTDETREGTVGVTRATIKKNKLAPPLRQSFYDLVFGEGADYFGNLIQTACRYKLGISSNRGWYTIETKDGEKKMRETEIVDLIKSGYVDGDADGIALIQLLVDRISDEVGIKIFDPTRLDREVGPFTVAKPKKKTTEMIVDPDPVEDARLGELDIVVS